MGVLKLAAIAAVGVSLLPSDRDKQEQLYARAASATTWAVTFCDRNAATCVQATSLWAEFTKKAEFGAKLALDMAREKEKAASMTHEDGAAPASYEPAVSRAGTLTPHDMKPAWRGKTANKAGI